VAASVDGPQQNAQLIAHRRVGFEGQPSELLTQFLDGAMDCQRAETLFQLGKWLAGDAHRGVPPAVASLAAAEGVTVKVERLAAEVPNPLPLPREERMFPMRRHQHEEPVVAQILDTRLPPLTLARARPLRDVQTILRDELRIRPGGIFPLRNPPRDIEQIPMGNVTDRQLLH